MAAATNLCSFRVQEPGEIALGVVTSARSSGTILGFSSLASPLNLGLQKHGLHSAGVGLTANIDGLSCSLCTENESLSGGYGVKKLVLTEIAEAVDVDRVFKQPPCTCTLRDAIGLAPGD
mmetsp:Transcript_39547/g.69538  ORF Transcript_39547/g.69538 Transcript_39547/m.69538 type:complete len:120 (+) Transcript_39547:180-539(+)